MSPAAAPPANARRIDLDGPFGLEAGGQLDAVTVAYESWGELSPAGDNAVLVCHALTGSSHVAGDDDAPGWWDGVVGPGRTLDPARHFIVCANHLAGCSGTTGPADIDPGTGRPWGMRFPVVTPRDMVAVQKALLDRLGVRRLAVVIGGSLGGMLVWQWLVDHPEMVAAAVPIASAPRTSAWAVALNAVARRAILADPAWNDGDYRDPGPAAGLALARQIAMISYRSQAELEARFGRRTQGGDNASVPNRGEELAVESYLRHHGEALVRRFDARSYVVLTEAMDRHDAGRGYDGLDAALARIRARVLAIGISSDTLFFPSELRDAVDRLRTLGGDARYEELTSIHGHDAFLIEQPRVEGMIGSFLEGGRSCAC